MYLPPDAPEQLVSAMSSMMSEGSAATGDVLMNMIGSPMVRLCVFVVFNKREKGKKKHDGFFFFLTMLLPFFHLSLHVSNRLALQ